jgi:hypothetical protein
MSDFQSAPFDARGFSKVQVMAWRGAGSSPRSAPVEIRLEQSADQRYWSRLGEALTLQHSVEEGVVDRDVRFDWIRLTGRVDAVGERQGLPDWTVKAMLHRESAAG